VKIQFLLLSAALALPGFGQALLAQTLTSSPLANPAGPGSLQPNWSVAPDGAAVFSWIEPSQGGFAAWGELVADGDHCDRPAFFPSPG